VKPPAVTRGSADSSAPPARIAGFRTKLLLAMMLVVSIVTGLALYFAQRNLAANVQRDLEREFQFELDALHKVREIRHVALLDRCRTIVRRPRITAALEEETALDLLYENASDELRDIRRREDDPPADPATDALRAQFYRFLDRKGAVIRPPNERLMRLAGALSTAEEGQLALPGAPAKLQVGYLARDALAEGSTMAEIIAMPIASSANGEITGALVLGFKPFEFGGSRSSGIWLQRRLHSTSFNPGVAAAAAAFMAAATAARHAEIPTQLQVAGTPHLIFAKGLNPESHFPLAYEVCVFPLTDLVQRQRELRWQVIGAAALLLLLGLGASHLISARLSAPVEKLAVDSERSARFSADASHQLKTPVTVLRAGLEELLTRENLTPEECDQLSALIHQTYRLSSLIEDLLLLSRMDAGRLKLEAAPVNLTHLIEASVDDLNATPDELGVAVETEYPPGLHVLGEKRYTAIILQNLLENARKYNRRGGRIRVVARSDGEVARLNVGNTGQSISAAAQVHIFERFHRASVGENVPGYGLGLNLARELARLHRGDLRLVRSEADWTEFEVSFRVAASVGGTAWGRDFSAQRETAAPVHSGRGPKPGKGGGR